MSVNLTNDRNVVLIKVYIMLNMKYIMQSSEANIHQNFITRQRLDLSLEAMQRTISCFGSKLTPDNRIYIIFIIGNILNLKVFFNFFFVLTKYSQLNFDVQADCV
jgi:hypothetical protein